MKWKNLKNKLAKRYKLVILSEHSFEEVWSYRLSLGNLIYSLIVISTLILVMGILLVIFTPLKQWIPDFPSPEIRESIINNSLRVDSLTSALKTHETYLTNVRKILVGDVTPNDLAENPISKSYRIDSIQERQYDSIIRSQVEYARTTTLLGNKSTKASLSLGQIQFFPPVRGVISNKFNNAEQHFGIDIVTKPETLVCATLSGTVINVGWTLEGGNVVQIQHENEIISVYKHNSKVLKKQGDYVYTGEPIAVVGNTGEYSTGPHLHFEIWYKGVPVDPAQYLNFN
ncbi:MAG TPA: M23 family metallopeptidase [Salinivirgaceae bacterium]|nr:M23 family metallopeptidase [Salinivirgaceae bacterium]